MLLDEEKRGIIRQAWQRGGEQVPFLIEIGEGLHANSAFLDDMALDLAWQEKHCAELEEGGSYFISNLKPNLGIGVVAASFGCEWVRDSKRDPWTKPIIGESNLEDVYGLAMPDPYQSGMNGLAFERINYFREYSRLPLRLVNIPSPLVTASLIWEYSSFIAGTITHPHEVHALLDMVTEATIQFVRMQLQQIGNRLFSMSHEPWYLPLDLGIRISDDTAAVMSPKAYREFGVPYNKRIAEAFGGIVIHACGNIVHVLPAILDIPGLVGIDMVAPQNDWRRVREIIRDRVALCFRYWSSDFPNSDPGDVAEYSRSLTDYFGKRGILLWAQANTLDDSKRLSQSLSEL